MKNTPQKPFNLQKFVDNVLDPTKIHSIEDQATTQEKVSGCAEAPKYTKNQEGL